MQINIFITDIIVGTAVANRSEVEFLDVVGLLVNFVAIRDTVSEGVIYFLMWIIN